MLSFFKKTKRKTTAQRRAAARRRPQTWQERLPRTLKKWGVRLAIVLGIFWVVMIGYAADVHTRTGQWLQQKTYTATANAGFKLQQIEVKGRIYTDPGALRQAIQTPQGDSLFAVDLDQARARIELFPWVEDVTLRRLWPDRIAIRLTERRPLALWQFGGTVSVIDTDGEVIRTDNLSPFANFPILTGADAPKYAPDLMAWLKAEPVIAKQVDSAMRIGGRRWDLKLKNGMKIKLPEEDIAFALARISEAEREYLIFSKEILSLDARFSDKLIVKASSGAADRIANALQNDTISVSR